MSKLINIFVALSLLSINGVALWLFHAGFEKDYQQRLASLQSHPMCKDTASKTAWVAYKNGEVRCFMENNMYPHRATGSNIE